MRIRISQSAMNKAGAYGLHLHEKNLSVLLKRMARLSGIASGNFNDQRRRYGSFFLTIRDNIVCDINCNEEDYCDLCLGIQITDDGEDCPCIHNEPQDAGGNYW